jgi:hypothetical protein
MRKFVAYVQYQRPTRVQCWASRLAVNILDDALMRERNNGIGIQSV